MERPPYKSDNKGNVKGDGIQRRETNKHRNGAVLEELQNRVTLEEGVCKETPIFLWCSCGDYFPEKK